MSKRIFDLEFHGIASIELDDAVINAVDADWRTSLYDLHGAEEIARHIGYNVVINGLHLSSMDGWADQDNANARIVGPVEWDTLVFERKVESK
jgi:hypothetical protein